VNVSSRSLKTAERLVSKYTRLLPACGRLARLCLHVDNDNFVCTWATVSRQGRAPHIFRTGPHLDKTRPGAPASDITLGNLIVGPYRYGHWSTYNSNSAYISLPFGVWAVPRPAGISTRMFPMLLTHWRHCYLLTSMSTPFAIYCSFRLSSPWPSAAAA